jgi:hypothetical protein
VGLCVLLSIALGGCDGGRSPSAKSPMDREPAIAGSSSTLCTTNVPCAPDFGCVIASPPSVVPAKGQCLPLGSAGALCREASNPQGVCDSLLACEGKGGTCVPLAQVNQACTGLACAAPLLCARSHEVEPVCTAPGALGGKCREGPGACDAQLGCLHGVCRPVATDGICFRNLSEFACAEGLLCSHFDGDPGDMLGKCLPPSVVGGACGDPALGRPTCVEGALCVDGVCRTDAVPPGGACLVQAPNVRCGDASTCIRDVCISLGTETAPCRPLPSVPCDPGLSCRDNVCKRSFDDGESCEPMSGAVVLCKPGSSCMKGSEGFFCKPDGVLDGRCDVRDAGSCDTGLVCARGSNNVSVCKMPQPVGATCSLAREPFEPCEAGASCSKQARACDFNGALGTMCPQGVCDEGLWCVPDAGVNRCYPAPPFVAVGDACDVRVDLIRRTNRCVDGAQCLEGVCVASGAANAACRTLGTNPRCDLGLACVGGVCQPGAPLGATCLPGGDSECGAPALCVSAGQAGKCLIVQGYDVTQSERGAFLDACDGGEVVSFTQSGQTEFERDDGERNVPLPFVFSFWGELHQSISIGVNGVAGFPPPGSFLNPGLGGAGALPMEGQPALIAPFFDDLVLGPAAKSRVCTKTTSNDGLRRFLVTWRGLQRFGHAQTSLTFTLVLHEQSSTIDFVYGDLFAPIGQEAFVSGINAVVGMQSTGGLKHVVQPGPVSVRRVVTFSPRN